MTTHVDCSLKNAYRVLLTRARQGMVIFVPNGDTNDATRLPEFYDGTRRYLKEIGFERDLITSPPPHPLTRNPLTNLRPPL